MDQERTMRFILENLAAVTASQQKADVQIKGIQKLVLTGMKLIVRLEKGQLELQTELKALAAAQKRTDQKFDRWLDSLKNGSNGHSGHKKR
jgi:hypothetical protein